MKKWLQDMFTKKESLENEEWRTEDSIFKFFVFRRLNGFHYYF